MFIDRFVKHRWLLVPLLLLIVVIGMAIGSIRVIPTGHAGVKETFGRAQKEELRPGEIHFAIPFIQKIIAMDTRLQNIDVPAKAHSRDLQVVTTKISVQWSIAPGMTEQCYMSIGDVNEINEYILMPAILESLKAATAKSTAEQLITQREMVKLKIVDGIQRFIADTLAKMHVPGGFLRGQRGNYRLRFFQRFQCGDLGKSEVWARCPEGGE